MANSKVSIVPMERTAAERQASQKAMEASAKNAPEYPYGLSLHLGDEELSKLGISGVPKVGDEYHVLAVAKVHSATHSEREGNGGAHRSVELQLTHMGVMHEDEAKGESLAAKAGKLYGSAEKAEGEA